MNITIKISTIKRVMYILVGLLFLILAIIIFMNNKSNQVTKTISMGAVELNVKDLAKLKAFYSELVGLEILEESSDEILLGDGPNEIIKLYQEENYTNAEISEAGLYHSAIVFPTRYSLALAVERVINSSPEVYQGSSDHIATEAFYFTDPEGNGVELYFDKPRSDWKYGADGKPLMGSTYINETDYINQHKNLVESTDQNTTMGHVHLKVGNIIDSKNFYTKILNFDLMNEMPQALFISKDNYHHHIGMNTWESAGSTERQENTYGLRSFTINFHEKNFFDEVLTNLKNDSIDYDEISDKVVKTQDPWNNVIYLKFIN